MLLFQEKKDSEVKTEITKVPLFKFPNFKDATSEFEKFASLANATMNPISMLAETLQSNLSVENLFGDWRKMEEAVSSLAGKFGGMREFADEIKASIEGATPSVVALGGTIEDVIAVQEGAIKALNRQVVLDQKAYGDLYAIGNLINDGSETNSALTEKLVGQFKDAGYSLYEVSSKMGDVVKDARDIGAASAAVYEQLSKNMDKLNLYNFSEGVKGMGKMAAEAAVLRLNMSDTLKVADKVFNPEDAIQMAADMQRLGVQVTNLLDPYKLMDMARNDPAELQTSILKAASALTYFDEKNQKISILPGQQGVLRDLAKSLGVSNEEMAKMAVNAADMERKMKVIKFNPILTEEKDQKFVASLAELKDGKYQVNMGIDPKTGEAIMKPIEQIGSEEIKRLKKAEADKAKSPSELLVESNHILTNLYNAVQSGKGIIPRRIAASKSMDNLVGKIGSVGMGSVQGFQESMGIKREEGGYINIDKVKESANELGNSLQKAVNGAKDGEQLTKVFVTLGTDLADHGKKFFSGFDKLVDNINAASKRLWETGVTPNQFEIDKKKAKKLTDMVVGTISTIYEDVLKEAKKRIKDILRGDGTNVNPPPDNNTNVNPPPDNNTNVNPPPDNNTNVNPPPDNNTNVNPPPSSSLFQMRGLSQTESQPLIASIEQGMGRALNVFQNPGTLKVTLYGEKIGLLDLMNKGVESNKIKIEAPKETPKSEIKVIENEGLKTLPVESKKTEIVKTITEVPKKEETSKIEIPKTENKLTSTTTNINYGDIVNAMSKGKFIFEELPGLLDKMGESTKDLKPTLSTIEKSLPTAEKMVETKKAPTDTKFIDLSQLTLKTPGIISESKTLETPKKESTDLGKTIDKVSNFSNTLSEIERRYFTTKVNLPEITMRTPGIVPETKLPTVENKITETLKTIVDIPKSLDMSGLKVPTAENRITEIVKNITDATKSVEKPEIKIPTAENRITEIVKNITDATKGMEKPEIKIPTISKAPEVTKTIVDRPKEEKTTLFDRLSSYMEKTMEVVKTVPEKTTESTITKENIFSKISELKTPVVETPKIEYPKSFDLSFINNLLPKPLESKTTERVSEKDTTMKEALTDSKKTYEKIESIVKPISSNLTLDLKSYLPKSLSLGAEKPEMDFSKITSGINNMVEQIKKDTKTPLFTKITEPILIPKEKTITETKIEKPEGLATTKPKTEEELHKMMFPLLDKTGTLAKLADLVGKDKEKVGGIVPGMKSEERESMVSPYLEKFGTLGKLADLYKKGTNVDTPVTKLVGPTPESIRQTNEMIRIARGEEKPTILSKTDITPRVKTENIIKKDYSENKLKTVSETIARTPVIPTLTTPPVTLPRTLMREETPTKTREGVTDNIHVSVTVKGEFPNDLQPIWNQALRNTQWMEQLQRTISASIVEKNALRGTGNYSKPFLT